jgi:hypothetical protein
VSPAPAWSEADIRASRVEPYPPGSLPDARQGAVAKADPMNLFIVVEAGDHHVSVLDGDRMERIHRFPSRYALHGGPKFTPDGRYVFFASRDGWVSKFDIWNLKVVAEVRAGLNTRNAAVSSDGRYVAVANYLPGNLVIFDADLKLLKVIDGRNLKGDASSRLSAVYDAAPRKSFIVGLKDLPEIWEVSYDPAAQPFYDGYVHDYKMGEALPRRAFSTPAAPCSTCRSTTSSSPRTTPTWSAPAAKAAARWSTSTCAGPSPPSTCPACRTWARASHGCATAGGWWPAPT